ncbi:MAG: hypothetical protein ACP5KK_03415, partial [Candidatus Nanoarchaeia archaeon]
MVNIVWYTEDLKKSINSKTLDDVVNVIKKYEGKVAETVAEYLGYTAKNTPEKLDDVVRAFDKYENIIKKYEGEVAEAVAKCLGYTAVSTPEKLDDVVNVIKKYEGWVA